MNLFISGDYCREEFNYDTVIDFNDSDVVLILPGGLGTFYDLFRSLGKKKRTILYNKDMYYAPLIKNLYNGYEKGLVDKLPSEYLEIESEAEVINNKLEEIKNGKVNDGEVSKLL